MKISNSTKTKIIDFLKIHNQKNTNFFNSKSVIRKKFVSQGHTWLQVNIIYGQCIICGKERF